MPEIEQLTEEGVSVEGALARDRALLAAAAGDRRAFLRLRTHPGEVLAIGRWHRRPKGHPGTTVVRRVTGGRTAPAGTGFVGVGLVLPHRSALGDTDPLALRAEQVMNRCVRGVLEAFRAHGIDAYYPGRDTITVGGRLLALLAMEVDDRDALLFETFVAFDADFTVLPRLLDRADPDGVITASVLGDDEVTSVARLRGAPMSLDELAAWMARGHATASGSAVVPARPVASVASPPLDDRDARLAHRGRVATMLGALEADVALAADGRLAAVQLTGDLIASAATIIALEHALPGTAAERDAVQRVVDGVVGTPGRFVLGVGPTRTITDAILAAVAR